MQRIPSLIKNEAFFFSLLFAYIVLVIINPRFLNPYFVEWKTVAIIASFIVINTGLFVSGGVSYLAKALLGRIHSLRMLALISVVFAAVLSMFITNDASLIVLVPLTVEIGKISNSDIRGIVILQAIATNAGSLLTPFGNPQNIIMFRNFGLSFITFVERMFPAFVVSIFVLVIFLFILQKDKPIRASASSYKITKPLLFGSIALFGAAIFSFLYDYSIWIFVALAIAGVALLIVFNPQKKRLVQRLEGIDVFLILTFILIFLVINSFSTLIPPIKSSSTALMFVYSILVSQFISNVPATVLLEKHFLFTQLAWGVNIGGNGTIIASLANIIALRSGSRVSMAKFMKVSIPYMLVTAAIALALIYFA